MESAVLLLTRGLTLIILSVTFFCCFNFLMCFFFFQAEDGIRDTSVTGVQTCALPIFRLTSEGNAPAFGPTVPHIDAVVAQKQVRRIDTEWVVARMAHTDAVMTRAGWNRAIVQLP